MFQRKITDEEFINSFQSFGFAARPAISYLLCEKLKSDKTLKENDIKAILLQTLENYYFQTEIVLMLLETMHIKKMFPEKSISSIYHKVFIKEGDLGVFSEELLTRIRNYDNLQLLEYLGLKKPEDLISNLSEEKKKELLSEYPKIEYFITLGYQEISNLKDSLESSISNRISFKDGTKVPFFKMLNKLKHGYQVIEDCEEKVLSILIDLTDTNKIESTFEVIEIPVNKETAYFYTDQTKYMAKSTQHLLRLYMLSYFR
jgi:hypothetical protein